MKYSASFVFCLLGLYSTVFAADDWLTVEIPGATRGTGVTVTRGPDGFAWYRTWVKAPDNFFNNRTKYEEIKYAETVGVVIRELADAYEVFINGTKIGTAGQFPPNFRSGRKEAHRFRVPLGVLRRGLWNEIALRVYNQPGAGGFEGGAPRILNNFSEAELKGAWEFAPGDDHRPGGALPDRPATSGFDQFSPSNYVIGRVEELDTGPKLSPQDSLAKMQSGPDLKVELLLHEPDVTQPTHLSFDERGRLWVTHYRQYPYPAGLKIIGRSPRQEAIFDRVPPPPPHHDRGADLITIHEDTDGDGHYDKRTVFQEGLNMANAALRGRGGVWVMNPPYLIFFPDRDFDDVPDGPPVVHLQGFGLEDTHSVANGLVWGSDGWLYGGQGSTTTSRVTRPVLDAPDAEGVYFDGSMVWRYHPETRAYEIFAKGGGNTFGLEVDAQGRLCSGYNGGKTRGFNYIQGGYFTLQRPGPGEMHAFGQLPYMHSHTVVPRFSHFGAFAEGTALPGRYQGHLFAIDPLHNDVIDVERTVVGSTFETRDLGRALRTDDVGFRPLFIVNAPDGSLMISDMYEYYTAHRNHYQSQIDPSTGRVYRLRGVSSSLETDINLERKPAAALVALLAHPNKWHRQMAARILGERKDPSVVGALRSMLEKNADLGALNALWALHQMGSLDDGTAQSALNHASAPVRMWSVRLLGDSYGVNRGPGLPGIAVGARRDGGLPAGLYEQLSELAGRETNAEVRAQIAATARRLSTPQALGLVAVLAQRDADVADAYIPLLGWWALEAHVNLDPEAVLGAFKTPALWDRALVQQHWLPSLMRRLAAEGTRRHLLLCARLLQMAPSPERSEGLLKGFEEAYRGRTMDDLPDELMRTLAATGRAPLALRIRQGEAQAIQEALERIADKKVAVEERILYTRIVGEVKAGAAAPPVLLGVAGGGDPVALRKSALVALANYDDPAIGEQAAALLSSTAGEIRTGVVALLASRAPWSRVLLQAVESGKVTAASVPPDMVARMRGHRDQEVASLLAKVFPPVAATAEAEFARRVAEVADALKEGKGDARAGERLFTQSCAACHLLFGKGAALGPDLTPYQRDNLETLLTHIINPNVEIREGYQYQMVVTADGRSLSGFLVSGDAQTIQLRGLEGEDISLRRSEVKSITAVPRSLMPEGLLDGMNAQQLRDFFAYLRLSRPN